MYKNNFTSKSYRNFKKVSINNFYKLFDNKINDLLLLSIFILTSLTNNAICQFVVNTIIIKIIFNFIVPSK